MGVPAHLRRGDGVVFDCCLFFVGVDGFLNLNVFDLNLYRVLCEG